uniref:RIN4 pathogenic type III effector avirulence factor Avr cleavage site domain-containing protein n=1 Tax=Oryza punctata TaxID=4537 RepID=A0A0E0MH05_ORYPU
MGNRKEQQEEQQQRARMPAFGEWDEMKAAGVLPDYSLDFSKIRAVRMQRKEGGPLTWSSTAAAGEVSGESNRRSSSAAGVFVDGRDRRRHRHRRHNSDGGADLRRPLRHDRAAAPKERSKLGYLFCCIAG